jgi:hypothetical protein
MNFNQLMYRAWFRDGSVIHTGEALMLICLMHAKGKDEEDYKEVQRIMKDKNYDGLRTGQGSRTARRK